ncbi:PREDICTED: putative F-box/FBD/LRR-repeat protein At1g22000 [Brassica oleracea var. oleracea]|uniref:F-box domain-containing protein n=1 Tax=Brassica oleracea var. oleracea TaxID=109376 RepID=A0A0D3C501_BRAOL|nr:PREDICTED: putative F-box/FBD/LRR-repeat protein At1g22000 [Brassica oleracea var. oleracea]
MYHSRQEDRISALPDDLLVRILLSIPTEEAVSTMILSKRWRFIWTMLPVLTYQERKVSVWLFLNKSMEFHKAPVLQILSIRLGPHCPTDADVGKWVENAVNRGVRELFFTLQWSADPTRLPKSLNTCKTLLHLRLSHKILVDFPTSSCLPSLERLQLYYVVYKDEASLVALLSSCPVLELLYVMRNEDDNVAKFSVKVPSTITFHQ